MGFVENKKKAMKALKKAEDRKEVDKDALPLLRILNRKKDYFTSSSCYGRIFLMHVTDSKKTSEFVKKWHRKVNFKEVKNALEKAKGNIWFRVDAFILHISCKNVEAANTILKIKTKTGIKRGGIFNIQPQRVQIELEGTQKMAVPVKFKDTLLVEDDYLKLLIKQVNSKIEKNQKTWEKLRKELLNLKP